jgi:hypothetical protein
VQVSSEEKEKRERREAQIQVPPKENWI